MEQIEGLIARILFPILIGWLFFKLVEYLTKKISLRDYEFEGDDLVGGRVKVVWYFADNTRKISGIKYSNDKYYFRVYTQFFKGEEGKTVVYSPVSINIEDKSSFDFATIVIFNKKEMSLKTRFKLLKWLIGEWIKNKIEPSRKKVLPKFLIEPHVFTDALYLNMESFYKNFKNQ